MVSRLGVRGVSNDVSSVATSAALAALVALLVVAWLAAQWLHRSNRFPSQSHGMWFAGLASLALIISVTLFRDGMPRTVDLDNLADWSRAGLRAFARDPLGSSQFILNLVLFVPAGAAWTLISKRPVLSWVALTVLTLLIESTQAVTGAGSNDVGDLLANSTGAAVGVVAAVVFRAFGTARDVDALAGRGRWGAWRVGGATVVGLTLVAAWFVGASGRQQHVEEMLRWRFEGTDRAEIDALLASDSNAVFGAADEFASGTRYTDDSIEIRYPATFFGLRRCVFVVWSAEGVEFRKGSGGTCTAYIDG